MNGKPYIGFFCLSGFLFCCVPFFSFFVNAQNIDHQKSLSDYQINQWTTDNGSISNSIIALYQSKKGYLWVGTYSGLMRFDGQNFKIYDKPNNEEITHEGIRVITESADGSLWLGTNGGGLLLLEGETISNITTQHGLSGNQVYAIHHLSESEILVGTSMGLDLIKLQNNKIDILPINGSKGRLPVVYAIASQNETIWLGTKQGLHYFNRKENTAKKFPDNRIENDEILDVKIDSNETVWVVSNTSGLFFIANNRLDQFRPTVGINNINNIVLHHDNAIFIGTDFGLYRFYDSTLSVINEENGLIDQNVSAITIDHEGNIWIGSYYAGLFQLKNSSFRKITAENGLREQIIHSIYEEIESDIIWVCTDNGIHTIINSTTAIPHQAINEKLPSGKSKDIVKDRFSNYWVASYGGLLRYRSENDFEVLDEQSGLSNNQVRNLFIDESDQLWIGTRSGLNKIELSEKNDFEIQNIKTSGRIDNALINQVTYDTYGNILVSTLSGIFVIENDTIKDIDADINRNLAVFHTNIDKKNKITWISSIGGLFAYKEGKLTIIEDDKRLLNKTVFQSIVHPDGRLWASTEQGVVQIQTQDVLRQLKIGDRDVIPSMIFGKEDGMPTNHCTAAGRGILSKNGVLWLPTIAGIALMHPDKHIRNINPPPVVIEYLIADKNTSYNFSESLSFDNRIQNLEIKYTGLSFFAPDKMNFRYMLVGYDDEWIEAGMRRTAYYTNITPGAYTFKVIAANNDNTWNYDGALLHITVRPPFWQRGWFIFIMVVFVIALVTFIHKLRMRNIKTLNRMLEYKVRERTIEISNQKEEIESQRDSIESKNRALAEAHDLIAAQNKELAKVNQTLEQKVDERTYELQLANIELDEFVYKASHDIKGPLARILGLIKLSLLEVNGTDIKVYLQKLKKEAELTNLALKKLIRARNIKNVDIKVSEINLKELIEQQISLVKDQEELEYVKVNWDIDDELHIHSDIFLLGNAIFPVIENAIQYQDQSKIEISIKIRSIEGNVHIYFTDKGSGIIPDAKARLFEMFFKGSNQSKGPGLGLYISKTALKRINGDIELISTRARETIFEISVSNLDKKVFNHQNQAT